MKSEGLNIRGSTNTRRCTDHMKFAANMAVRLSHSFIFFVSIFVYFYTYGCMFCMLLFNFVTYVFLLLYILIVIFMYSYR